MLLVLVYGVFLVLVGVTAGALVMVSSAHLSSATLAATVARDGAIVELALGRDLDPADLLVGELTAARRAGVETGLGRLATDAGFLRIEVRSPAGATLLASTGSWAAPPVDDADWATALGGHGAVSLVENADLPDGAVQELLPLSAPGGELRAVVAVWRDAAPVLARLDAARRDIMLVTLAAALLLAVLLFAVFRAAQARISRQQALLLESERRDPLTGLLNHGAIVGAVAQLLEERRAAGGSLSVALLDVDNFRLLNDTHGHEAGDEVLRCVAEIAARHDHAEEPGGVQVSRYGPDEFLLVCPDDDGGEATARVARMQELLIGVAVQFGESERLPVTVSAGVCSFPDQASSVTELLSGAAVAAAEARASGGDAIRAFGARSEEEPGIGGGFDVLHGLVIAVDTKDRYTKRHSEDVARYAVFLAQRLGLDEEAVRTIRLAGLLHDVGKIGIPDGLLRKPSKLTDEEFAVFQQHVVLGDAIVRDLPHADEVRAGIRFHHERWDGHGYVEGREGEAIPIIGRILAVADAFSAMTTTRPYRKALSMREALKRLGGAAGTQLQEDLVAAFIDGIETAPDAPLPGEAPAELWRPSLWVA
jgi:diguanylate cyclase (GGDEF)-like protein/putative nucleotidyltransferase with HDIG domain